MPDYGYGYERRRIERSRLIRAKLLAKGMHPSSSGFMRAYYKAMRK
jgi:hypothetical protein